MGMRMGDVSAGELERRAANPVLCFQDAGEPLSEDDDSRSKLGGEVIEGRVVIARDDLHMPGPDRAGIEKGDQIVVLIDDVGRDLAPRDAAEEAWM
jgi:hypothetical protein